MPDLFKHIVPAILQTKRDYYRNPLDEESENHMEKAYVPFVVNKALSFYMDCIMQSNEINKLPNIDKKLQNDFYLNIIRGYKRPFQKWVKNILPDDLELVKERYNVSNEKAREYLLLLTAEQIKRIKEEKGGIENGSKSKRSGVGNTKTKG